MKFVGVFVNKWSLLHSVTCRKSLVSCVCLAAVCVAALTSCPVCISDPEKLLLHNLSVTTFKATKHKVVHQHRICLLIVPVCDRRYKVKTCKPTVAANFH